MAGIKILSSRDINVPTKESLGIELCMYTNYTLDRFLEERSSGVFWDKLKRVFGEDFSDEVRSERILILVDVKGFDGDQNNKRNFKVSGDLKNDRIGVYGLLFGMKEDKDKFAEKSGEENLETVKKFSYNEVKIIYNKK